jgi:hypothetical protein
MDLSRLTTFEISFLKVKGDKLGGCQGFLEFHISK